MRISAWSADAIAGPSTKPNCPDGTPGQLCRPETASTGNGSNSRY